MFYFLHKFLYPQTELVTETFPRTSLLYVLIEHSLQCIERGRHEKVQRSLLFKLRSPPIVSILKWWPCKAYDNDNSSVSVVFFPECPRFHWWKHRGANFHRAAADHRGCCMTQPTAAVSGVVQVQLVWWNFFSNPKMRKHLILKIPLR